MIIHLLLLCSPAEIRLMLLTTLLIHTHVRFIVHRAQDQDLLVDDLDSQRTGRAGDAFDDGFHGGVPHFEAVILGFNPCDLVHRPHGHHPCSLVAFTHKTRV